LIVLPDAIGIASYEVDLIAFTFGFQRTPAGFVPASSG